jgi:hypothetical protein
MYHWYIAQGASRHEVLFLTYYRILMVGVLFTDWIVQDSHRNDGLLVIFHLKQSNAREPAPRRHCS